MNNFPLILLIGENLLLLTALTIWCTRKCITCQQVKCIESILSRTCQKCQKDPQKSKPQLEI